MTNILTISNLDKDVQIKLLQSALKAIFYLSLFNLSISSRAKDAKLSSLIDPIVLETLFSTRNVDDDTKNFSISPEEFWRIFDELGCERKLSE